MSAEVPVEVTVAIPTYNRRDLLSATIESVLEQQDVSFEVIVLDNASTDGTPEFVESLHDPRVQVICAPTNTGLIANFNRALSAGRAPFLTVLHDDDLRRPGSLALRLELLKSDTSMAVAYSYYGVIDQDGVVTRPIYRSHIVSGSIEGAEAFLRAALHGQVRCHMSAALIRRSTLGELRCRDEDGSFTDHGLWMRLACSGSFGLIPLALADVRVHSSAGAAMGNFRLDENGNVVPFATEQTIRTLEIARRVLKDPGLAVPHRRRLRARAEIEGFRQIGRSVGDDLAVPGTGVLEPVLRAVRSHPAAAVNRRLLLAVAVRLRNRIRTNLRRTDDGEVPRNPRT